MTYAFTFDANTCPEGCRDCQVACQKKNQLPADVMWRRVIEVASGEGTNSIFAYNLSIACNHCVHPKCAGVCPVDAYVIRSDGIIFIDSSKCMGCGYCGWACPYGAPQYNPVQGQMTKCDFCYDAIDAGLPPSCIAACQLWALKFTKVDELNENLPGYALWTLPAADHPFPLPQNSHTEPHLAIKQHPAMNLPLEKRISNQEEIKPKKQKSDTPLIVFTLFVQMAVGAFWAAQWMFTQLWNLRGFDMWLLRLAPYLMIGVCLGVGGLFSFAHLGTKRNAWRALTHLRKSWLSREILYVGLFGTGCFVSSAPLPWQVLVIVRGITSILGIALISSMAQVYHLQTIPAWNTWRTTASFFVTALLLGQLLMLNVLIAESQFNGINLSSILSLGNTIMLLVGELWLVMSKKENIDRRVGRLRVGLIVTAIIGVGIMLIMPNQFGMWFSLSVFIIVLVEEIIGRWQFYEALKRRML